MNPQQQSELTLQICAQGPVVPVLVIDRLEHARPLAQALVDGGLTTLEVTLRTPCALEAIAEMAQVPGATVGAGTLLTPDDVAAAKQVGAVFGVSPGGTAPVIDACVANALPLLPGAATATEAMALMDRGYSVQKFFPAEAIGGARALAALAAPLPQIKFCPTGGITEALAPDYLALPNVICVGGSWIAPRSALDAGDWGAITRLAHTAAGLAQG
ncbi:bifunctional 4-hydroxy-2-oxoglutarate aldolase/2-dehydro-3-deoxy-phosphogluconate aldolase [Rhodobacteraceae bacterium 2376]|uniref:2-dehydro-3-deoxy-phosphogluconate aldolase n=1 Tax=Rhabdonatronobacter sediminivivens TaxID=2743469 RepID=A0A7Z0HXY1_9RHOB|nr:bifunctional 4-hydroxy-2-oxoglutarate aldolase/2-dehydro-3-deoxy-phosphogluconate aldolase [Rhabdonatronobacter sediminivivens]NYS24330.1 bifunctional 4-hydroxy-2-oxoglutarate aldolase/2-dehydro-3-deoxy-phosphogluconate aldolase [Rhabdonatronobacter sediminivivens]